MNNVEQLWQKIQKTATVLQNMATMSPGPELMELVMSNSEAIRTFKEDLALFLKKIPSSDPRREAAIKVQELFANIKS